MCVCVCMIVTTSGSTTAKRPWDNRSSNSWLQNEGPGLIPVWGVIFLFTPEPSKPLIQWMPICTSLEAKRPKCEADNSSATIALGSGTERT